MPISSIRLQQFRSYQDATFQLDDTVNLIVGPNGSGKTNLLEALYVLARGKAFRVADGDLLMHGVDWARLDAIVDETSRAITLKKEAAAVKKQLHIDGVIKKRLGSRERLAAVLFEPRDMELLTGSPQRRRTYIDTILEQLHVGYMTTLQRYRRALLQRNYLLKQPRTVPADHFFVWNVRLSELGAQITMRRRELISLMNQTATNLYRSISDTAASVVIEYDEARPEIGGTELASILLRRLEQDFPLDLERGFTRTGPHRDDLAIRLDGSIAATSASRGETRSLVVMLKLLEAQLLQERYHASPLMLLDDVFGELDTHRRAALAHHLRSAQTIITSTDAEMSIKETAQQTIINLQR